MAMADTVTDQLAKLQLDEETGELVSKNELKRRLQKRAKKAAAASINVSSTPTVKTKPISEAERPDVELVDHNALFSRGLLAEIYRLRPSTHVVTRFPPEPNGYLHVGLFRWLDALGTKVNEAVARACQGNCHQLWVCKISWRRDGRLTLVSRLS